MGNSLPEHVETISVFILLQEKLYKCTGVHRGLKKAYWLLLAQAVTILQVPGDGENT